MITMKEYTALHIGSRAQFARFLGRSVRTAIRYNRYPGEMRLKDVVKVVGEGEE